MKTLFLLRHAKAENSVPGASDLERLLDKRGRHEAQALGRWLKQQDSRPDLVLCSTAMRAQETAALVLGSAELDLDVRYDNRLYEAGPRQLLEVISEVEEETSAVLLVGHNPGMAELLQLLTGRAEHMGTCTLARLNLSADHWSNVQESKARLERLLPAELTAD